MTIKLFSHMIYKFKQSHFKKGLLLTLCVFSSSCVSHSPNEIEPSAPLNKIDKTYPLVYEIVEVRGQMDLLFDFIPGQDSMIIENDRQWKVIDLATKKVLKAVATKGIAMDFKQLSQTNNRLMVASIDPDTKTNEKVEIWDTRTWEVLKTFDGGGAAVWNVGLSPDGRLLFMEGALWSVKSGKKLVDIGFGFRRIDHSFSSDSRYFVVSSMSGGTQLIDIKAKKEIPRKTRINDNIQFRFRDDHYFYASYNFDFNASYEYGGNYHKAVGLFSPTHNDLVRKYSSPDWITCWTVAGNGNVIVARVNGDIILLSRELVPLKKWSLKQKAHNCAADNKNQVWLGVDDVGIYKIDLTRQTIEHPIKLSQNILKFILSQDGKYLGFESEIDGLFRLRVYRVD